MSAEFSIIIPTLDEAAGIGRTLDALQCFREHAEIIIADGGSSDETVSIAESRGAKVIAAPRGRGIQLHAGACAATGSVLWFLHADSIPPPDALRKIGLALEDDESVGGNFVLQFDGDSRAARFMTWFYDKIRHIGLLYGDSGIFVRRDVYQRIGGFKPLPSFDDLDFIGRLKMEGILVRLQGKLVTSSRRFEGRPFVPVFLRWVLYQCLYWLGVSPFWLAKAYYPVRQEKDSTVSAPDANNSR